jgi:hypothetical protein
MSKFPSCFAPKTLETHLNYALNVVESRDSLRHGQCNNLLISGRQPLSCLQSGIRCYGYYCAFTHDGEDHQTQITSTTVVAGQTGTVIFEPVTLTEYAGLRMSTTVALTDVATTTDGGSSMETVLAVIFAGGLAWLAVCKFLNMGHL